MPQVAALALPALGRLAAGAVAKKVAGAALHKGLEKVSSFAPSNQAEQQMSQQQQQQPIMAPTPTPIFAQEASENYSSLLQASQFAYQTPSP